jgi:hypothetical protein
MTFVERTMPDTPQVPKKAPGDAPTDLTGIVGLTIYLAVVAAVACIILGVAWPSCDVPAAATTETASDKSAKADEKKSAEKPTVSIIAVEPDTGSVAGQQQVTIHGEGFSDKAMVLFGGHLLKPRDVSPVKLTVTTPAHPPGKVDVKVRDGQTAVLAGGFTYVCPAPRPCVLILMVLAAGALGGALHGLFSIADYVGNRELKESWTLWYILLPWKGALIALVFFLVVRAGFYSPQGSPTQDLLLLGLSALVGLFTPQAMEKLKQIADALLTKPQPRKDAMQPAVGAGTLTEVTPGAGAEQTETPVTLRGTGFENVKEVRFGDRLATITSMDKTAIVVTTPKLPAGKVPVTVALQNGQSIVKPEAYVYVGPLTLNPAAAATTAVEISAPAMPEIVGVKFGALAAAIVSQGPGTVKVTPPTGPSTGTQVKVTVEFAVGGGVAKDNAYTY